MHVCSAWIALLVIIALVINDQHCRVKKPPDSAHTDALMVKKTAGLSFTLCWSAGWKINAEKLKKNWNSFVFTNTHHQTAAQQRQRLIHGQRKAEKWLKKEKNGQTENWNWSDMGAPGPCYDEVWWRNSNREWRVGGGSVLGCLSTVSVNKAIPLVKDSFYL